MNALCFLVPKSLRQHALSTGVTAFSIALASGLLMSVFSIKAQTHDAFTSDDVGFDAVLGARGSQLQLVLNTVFHLETSPGNLPWKLYQDIRKDPRVKVAIPYAVGDNYKGFRIVGTTDELFTKVARKRGRGFELDAGGRWFDPTAKEAVIGSFAAARAGLRVGATFNPYHGVAFDETMKHSDEYRVVGVLKPTNTPSDRVVWIPIEGVYRMAGHVLRGSGSVYEAKQGQAIPDENKEISAVMLQLRSPTAGFMLDQMINKQGRVATLAWPIGAAMADIFDKMGWLDRILGLVSYLVVLVACASILASLYNSISGRRREFAILRSLGATPATIFSVIIAEAAATAALGVLGGFGMYALTLAGAAVVIRAQTGVVLEVAHFHPVLAWTPPALVILGALAGVLPALRAYATDVASNLNPST